MGRTTVKTATLSQFAERILKRLDEGGTARRHGDGYRLGATQVPDALVRQLLHEDLISVGDEGLRLTSRGSARLRRQHAAKERPNAYGERPDPYQAQHQVRRHVRLRTADGEQRAMRNLAESPLYWLLSRKLITQAQFEAGERLREDWELAHRGPRVTMRWDGQPSQRGGAGEPHDPTPVELRAKLRLERAIEALGPGLSDVAIHICCKYAGLEGAERAMSWPQRSAKVVLTIALEHLARHYRLG